MEFEVNLTLCVQAFNFFCAYTLIRYFLLKPVLAHVQTERLYRQSLQAAISDRTVVIEQKIFEREEDWKAYQRRLAQSEPPQRALDDRCLVGLTPAMNMPEITQQELEKAVEHSVAVMKKIEDIP